MAPFDPDDLGADFHLLKNGPVIHYHRPEVLSDAVAVLADLGYVIHRFDARDWVTRADFAAAMKSGLDFPDHFGGNLDAFNDCLGDVVTSAPGGTGTVLVFTGYDTFAARDPRAAQAVLDIIADNARFGMLFGHRMACLVQTDDPAVRFTPVGATAVDYSPAENRLR